MATTKTSKPRSKPSKTGVSVNVVGTDGKAKGSISLPKALFSASMNKQLIAQAVRVHLVNQREGSAHTKTRGEVEGSTRKIYRQKGTGRARHGAIRAPIFVGGGISFGPRAHAVRLTMPQKMRRAALASALTEQKNQGNLKVIAGLNDLEPKTKAVAGAIAASEAVYPVLLVISKDAALVVRAARNIAFVDIARPGDLNTYDVLSHRTILVMKEAVLEL